MDATTPLATRRTRRSPNVTVLGAESNRRLDRVGGSTQGKVRTSFPKRALGRCCTVIPTAGIEPPQHGQSAITAGARSPIDAPSRSAVARPLPAWSGRCAVAGSGTSYW